MVDMDYINRIQNEIFSQERQNEKNNYVAQEMMRILLIEEKDIINRKDIVDIFNRMVEPLINFSS